MSEVEKVAKETNPAAASAEAEAHPVVATVSFPPAVLTINEPPQKPDGEK